MSPSIHPLPTVPRPLGAALPSGLGAGGRGKEKAPCRYLHFEVDYEEHEDGTLPVRSAKPLIGPRLDIGLGPSVTPAKVVRACTTHDSRGANFPIPSSTLRSG